MADNRKAGKLILDNLAMFNESVELFEQQIQPEIFNAIRDCVENWAKENGWLTVFDWIENSDNCWLAPASWKKDGEDIDANVWFGFWYENGESGSCNLANLCGCGQDRIGFIWGDPSFLGINKKQWKDFCKSVPAEKASKLSEIGFIQEYSWFTGWFRAVTLDSEELAIAYENEDYAKALQPLIQTLDLLKNNLAIFDEILAIKP